MPLPKYLALIHCQPPIALSHDVHLNSHLWLVATYSLPCCC
uniref:Uncharacterized protein n=1 Tax=Anguilla anguilla TaxID=7936 RepID=A0A0E9P5W7_ANGAN